LIRTRTIHISIAVAIAAVCVFVAASRAREDAGDWIKKGKRALDDGHVAAAESSFARAAAIGSGDDRSEALFLRASVTRSGKEAEALYRTLLDTDPSGGYSRRAVVELAKIQFATGRYEGAYATLHESDASDESEEASLFEGMAAVMLRRYDDAMAPLQHVRKGRAKVWAMLSLAEATDGRGQNSEACAQYEALARARVSPAAWYRHAECLEKSGNKDEALKEYAALVEAFPLTPEAVRASEKQASPPAPATSSSETPPPAPPGAQDSPRGAGFTVQFGSFGERANAIKMQSEIKKQYPNVRIDSELVNYKEVFRVRCGFYATRDAAQQAGEQMSKALGEPFTIMPVAASNER
jgi:cell division septation protein DedD